ncbi:MAG: hypothetical protein ABR554_13795, partial [Pyrinomonadaceae bacterium]
RMYPMPIGTRDRHCRHYHCPSYVRRFVQGCGASAVPVDRCEERAWLEIKQYLQKPELMAKEVERVPPDSIDSQLLKDREVTQNALVRHDQDTQRLV